MQIELKTALQFILEFNQINDVWAVYTKYHCIGLFRAFSSA